MEYMTHIARYKNETYELTPCNTNEGVLTFNFSDNKEFPSSIVESERVNILLASGEFIFTEVSRTWIGGFSLSKIY
ncbi:hypothetical protein ABN125_17120 [Proteus terrae]|uniref:hypothetical protein n=1 Tax=Proteus terrae TaxID=1574161 RepID=UPI0032D9E04A